MSKIQNFGLPFDIDKTCVYDETVGHAENAGDEHKVKIVF